MTVVLLVIISKFEICYTTETFITRKRNQLESIYNTINNIFSDIEFTSNKRLRKKNGRQISERSSDENVKKFNLH